MKTALAAPEDDFKDDGLDAQERSAQAVKEAVSGLIQRLSKEADDRVSRRYTIEQRWLTDLRQYHGQYEADVLGRLKDSKKSRLFINQTGPKTDAMAARLSDLLFPTDDRNWGIKPTPVPELAEEAQKALKAAEEAVATAAQMPQEAPEAGPAIATANAAHKAAMALRDQIQEARKRCDAMQEEIDDQLKECRYQASARDVIEDGCKLGTGVMKGPILAGKGRTKWQQTPEAPGVYQQTVVENTRPAYRRVDPWNFFPDPDARTIQESESVFERHLMKPKELRRLAKQPGFDPSAIRTVLRSTRKQSAPQYLSDLRSITHETADMTSDYHIVWEYHGPITAEDLTQLVIASGDPDRVEDLPDTEVDPLDELMVTIWFCEDQVMKFGLYPMETGDCIYSVFNLKKDESSIFGFGMPYLIAAPQSALNGAWRMMMDNSGLSTGPQIVLDMEVIEPFDGKWELTPRKLWKRKANAPPGRPAMETYNIDSHQAELAGIIELSGKFLDEVGSLPLIAQGEQGARQTQTMGGMTILMNSANVVFRRIVKNYDDDVTTPDIKRLYDWNMMYSKKDYIKGDYEVDARGSSVLLVREMQAQNLMAIAMNFASHPEFGPLIKKLELLRKIFQAHMLAADDVVVNDDEYKEITSEPPPEDPKLTAQREHDAVLVEIANMERDTKTLIAKTEHESRMMQLAATMNMGLDKIQADLEKIRMKADSDERQFAAELAKTEQIGPTGGGSF